MDCLWGAQILGLERGGFATQKHRWIETLPVDTQPNSFKEAYAVVFTIYTLETRQLNQGMKIYTDATKVHWFVVTQLNDADGMLGENDFWPSLWSLSIGCKYTRLFYLYWWKNFYAFIYPNSANVLSKSEAELCIMSQSLDLKKNISKRIIKEPFLQSVSKITHSYYKFLIFKVNMAADSPTQVSNNLMHTEFWQEKWLRDINLCWNCINSTSSVDWWIIFFYEYNIKAFVSLLTEGNWR